MVSAVLGALLSSGVGAPGVCARGRRRSKRKAGSRALCVRCTCDKV